MVSDSLISASEMALNFYTVLLQFDPTVLVQFDPLFRCCQLSVMATDSS